MIRSNDYEDFIKTERQCGGMKKGDRVRVARMSDYDMMVHKAQGIPTEIGRTGVVKELGFSRSHGDIVTVLMDDTKNLTIWCENELELIK